jgi:hypothetical protein
MEIYPGYIFLRFCSASSITGILRDREREKEFIPNYDISGRWPEELSGWQCPAFISLRGFSWLKPDPQENRFHPLLIVNFCRITDFTWYT